MNLDNLTPEIIANGPVPLDELLRDSVFYPASRTDGTPIALCNTVWRDLGVNSFVYCDFDLSEEEFVRDCRTLHGYHVIGQRHLDRSEYVPSDWALEFAPARGDGRRGGYWDSFLGRQDGPEHCAHWAVFERDADISPAHGPERLSVLYVCGEGLATFQQLYCSRSIAPRMVFFIQCWGFAGNWTNFSAPGAPFHRTLLKYPGSIPEWVCLGDCKGIHGAIRLRGLDYGGVRLHSYETSAGVIDLAGGEPMRMSDGVFAWINGPRCYAALNVSHQMGWVVYDVTDGKFPVEVLSKWLTRSDDGCRSGIGGRVDRWAGFLGKDSDGTPILDEKLEWRHNGCHPQQSMANSIVESVKALFSEPGMRYYTPLMKENMLWARGILMRDVKVIRVNGLPDLKVMFNLDWCQKWINALPTCREATSVNIGFGRC